MIGNDGFCVLSQIDFTLIRPPKVWPLNGRVSSCIRNVLMDKRSLWVVGVLLTIETRKSFYLVLFDSIIGCSLRTQVEDPEGEDRQTGTGGITDSFLKGGRTLLRLNLWPKSTKRFSFSFWLYKWSVDKHLSLSMNDGVQPSSYMFIFSVSGCK